MAIRVGVVGVGFGSTVHVPAFVSEGLEVVAICSRREARVKEAAARLSIPHAFTSYDEMLGLNGLDAVAIASPVRFHGEMTGAALSAGKHVLCEKPFVLEASEARALCDQAERSGLTAMIAHEFRFASARQRAKELIAEGYLGKVQMVLCRLALSFPGTGAGPGEFNEERDVLDNGGGMLFALGSHYIDGIRDLLGEEITAASGKLFTFAPERVRDGAVVKADADDSFVFQLTLSGGGVAEMATTRNAIGASESSISIYGSEGTLVTPQIGPNPPAHGTLLGAQRGDSALSELEIPTRLEPFADERDDRLMPFRILVREFVRGIEEKCSPAPNLMDAYRCQLVLDAIKQSSRSGETVAIPAS